MSKKMIENVQKMTENVQKGLKMSKKD
jgi:hypothetical protein